MSNYNKVIWSEGMFLRSQHFQQAHRYLEHYTGRRINVLGHYLWGIEKISIDHDALNLGKLSLSEINGVFPDGTPIHAPNIEDIPDVFDIPLNTQNQIIYLCLPLQRLGSQDATSDPSQCPQARYQIVNFDARNNTTSSGEEARIQVGKLRICLKLESEDRSGYTSIGIARILEYLPEHSIKLDQQFIPPFLNCSESSAFKSYLEEIQGLLKQRASALAGRLTDGGRSGSAEIADYLLLQVINRVEPLLRQLAIQPRLHPYQLYMTLLPLAGELATFTSSSKRPAELESYRHEQLKETFQQLFTLLRQSLSTVLEQTAIPLDLVERKYGIFVAPINDPSLLSHSTFILAVKADMPVELLRNRFPTQARVAPVETIRDLISTHSPGLTLRALPIAPRQVPYYAGSLYFEIEPTGTLWSSMQQSGGVAVHLGAEFPNLSMELWAIRN